MNSKHMELLQAVPNVRFKWVLASMEGGQRETGNIDPNEVNVLSIGGEHIGLHGEWLLDNPYHISRSFFSEMSTGVIQPNDILLVKDGATIGKAVIADPMPSDEAAVNEHVFLLRISDEDYPKYYFYVVQSSLFQSQIWLDVRGSAQPGLTSEFRNRVIVPRPSRKRQCTIADYLDQETARLDALIAAKQHLLPLLAEKRQAFITHAVTCGLHPSTLMRDSGISWLDEVPAHWEIWKIGHLAIVGNGSTPSRNNESYWADDGIPWLNSGVVNQPEINSADQFVTKLATRRCHLPMVGSGAVLIAITGQGKTRGRASVLSIDATISQHLAFIQPRGHRLRPWFLKWVLVAAYDFLRSISDDAGGTKGALTCEQIANLRVPVPPLNEQDEILSQVTATVAKMESFQSVVGRAIQIIKERRAAVISNAVAGELDLGSAT